MENIKFITNSLTQAWLEQFDKADQPYVVRMLKVIKLVSRDDFINNLRERLLQLSINRRGRLGLYAERESPKKMNQVVPLFKQPDDQPRRAYGAGPLPIQALENNTGDIGSEGIIAHLLSELARENSHTFISHPGPDAIRKKNKPIRTLVLVTDFIGSGQRIYDYLDSFWNVFSIKSWWSSFRNKGLEFNVIAYTSTTKGKKLIESHPLAPKVTVVIECPTIKNSFNSQDATAINQICIKYNPTKKGDLQNALGYESTGALLAFSHGIPNNSPRIFHAYNSKWSPLFPKRVTAALQPTFNSELSLDLVQSRLKAMGHKKLNLLRNQAKQKGINNTVCEKNLKTYLVLAALSHSPRTIEATSSKTGLTQIEVEIILNQIRSYDWIDSSNRLTNQGQNQLKAAKRKEPPNPPPLEKKEFLYYPQNLRVPFNSSS